MLPRIYNYTKVKSKVNNDPFKTRKKKSINKYKRKNKIAVYTAIIGNYDEPKKYSVVDPNVDYILFTDNKNIKNHGFWKIKYIECGGESKVKTARKIKTNPHQYLRGYDVAIWVDGNITINCDIQNYIRPLQSSDKCISAITHPIRNCIYEEANEAVKRNKDKFENILPQIEKYKNMNYPQNEGLIESNIMIINLLHPKTPLIMSTWWEEIKKYSHRDQISLMYAIRSHNEDYLPLLQEGKCARTHEDFRLFNHGQNKDIKAAKYVNRPTIDIIICVHDALKHVKKCLTSVIESKDKDDNLIIVNDNSNEKTTDYLSQIYNTNKNIKIITNKEATGYCVSANSGMRESKSEYFLLLNSDTILTKHALNSMIHVLLKYPKTGIVGPLSNAASYQSIPSIQSNKEGQTAINPLPHNISLTKVNKLCKSWSHPYPPAYVPLIHGFCQLIRREVYLEIGQFDEANFPRGYGEENDFCFRATDAGYDLQVATNSYVYHYKSASYPDTDRIKLMKSASIRLKEKHSEERVKEATKIMRYHPMLVSIREKAQEYFHELI